MILDECKMLDEQTANKDEESARKRKLSANSKENDLPLNKLQGNKSRRDRLQSIVDKENINENVPRKFDELDAYNEVFELTNDVIEEEIVHADAGKSPTNLEVSLSGLDNGNGENITPPGVNAGDGAETNDNVDNEFIESPNDVQVGESDDLITSPKNVTVDDEHERKGNVDDETSSSGNSSSEESSETGSGSSSSSGESSTGNDSEESSEEEKETSRFVNRRILEEKI